MPIVLRLDHGPQLEVCWEKFDDLSITWDTIDVTVKPRAWVEWPLEDENGLAAQPPSRDADHDWRRI